MSIAFSNNDLEYIEWALMHQQEKMEQYSSWWDVGDSAHLDLRKQANQLKRIREEISLYLKNKVAEE